MSDLRGAQLGTYGAYMGTNQNFSEQVARSVATAIEAAGENPKSIADATGIARMTLVRRLTGTSPFTVAELAVIARHLDTTPDTFTSMATL